MFLLFLWADELAEGSDLARHFGALCIETSAKQRINVDEAFMAVVRAIRRYNKESGPQPTSAAQGKTSNAAGGRVGSDEKDGHKGGCCGCVVL